MDNYLKYKSALRINVLRISIIQKYIYIYFFIKRHSRTLSYVKIDKLCSCGTDKSEILNYAGSR